MATEADENWKIGGKLILNEQPQILVTDFKAIMKVLQPRINQNEKIFTQTSI